MKDLIFANEQNENDFILFLGCGDCSLFHETLSISDNVAVEKREELIPKLTHISKLSPYTEYPYSARISYLIEEIKSSSINYFKIILREA